ncbi:MAG: helix-turn-helix domain-containing protein, partial [Actinocrinis sp.]
MDAKERDPGLDPLGLPDPDGRVYVALVARPHATSAEIAAECDLSPAAAARALGRLTQGGLVSRTGHPARYLAVEPDVALGDLINRQEARLGEA